MKRVAVAIASIPLALALALPTSAQEATAVTGKLVDIATYVTHDHNMDSMQAMKHDSMSGKAMAHGSQMADHAMSGSMSGGSMKGGHMASTACPAMGIVDDAGRVYLVATQMETSKGRDLCRKMNSKVSLAGKLYTQGGMSVLLVK